MLFSETNHTLDMPAPCGHTAHFLNVTAEVHVDTTVPLPVCTFKVSQSISRL